MDKYSADEIVAFLREQHHRYTSAEWGNPTSIWKQAAELIEELQKR